MIKKNYQVYEVEAINRFVPEEKAGLRSSTLSYTIKNEKYFKSLK